MAVLAVALAGCTTLVDASDLPPDASAASDHDAGGAGPDAVAEPCSARELGEDVEAVFTTAHRVVDGRLGGLCRGEPSEQLRQVWDLVATMVPPDQLRPLELFALFEDRTTGEDVTLAFVTPVDDLGQGFLMAFEATESAADPDQLLLTAAHEYFHVLHGTPDQLDRAAPVGTCPGTYDNGEGCYLPDSYVQRWIEAFWDPADLAAVDVDDEPDVADGEERCDLDDGFLGPYAATTPEEDVAEAFAAFVLDLEPLTDGQADRLSWFLDEPELVEVRDRARAAGLGPLDNTFEVCG